MMPTVIPDSILLLLDLIFGSFHISVLYFLIVARKRNVQVYQSPFYLLYIMISFCDIGHVVGSIIYYQGSRFRIAQAFYESSAIWACATNGIISYTAHFEIIGHTMIAFNRYNAFRQIEVTKNVWSKRLIHIICGIMIVVPFCMYAYRFPFEIRYRFTDTGTGVSVSFTRTEIQKVVSYVNLSYYIVNVFATLIFSILTYQGCQRLTRKRGTVNQSELHEMKLFIFSLCTFSCLIARLCYELTVLTASFLNQSTIIGYAQFVLPFIGSAYALSGSIFLLALSSRVRRDYLHFYHIKHIPAGSQKSATFIVSQSHYTSTPSVM